MKPVLAEVGQLFPEGNCANIAAMLRQAADTIADETGDDNRTRAMIAVQVHEDGTIQLYGWGRTDTMHAIAALQLGMARMVADSLE